MKKIIALILILFGGQVCKANMASPTLAGTLSSQAISSKDINILSEFIDIKIAADFQTAKFIVEYTIENNVAGNQIPLLFVADSYDNQNGVFSVWMDDSSVQVQTIPKKYETFKNSPFAGFANTIKLNSNDDIEINWQGGATETYSIDNLKYFEANISKGIHKIKVAYTAMATIDRHDWLQSYRFNYSLSPAKYWKSFGALHIAVEQEGEVKNYTTNFGSPNEKEIGLRNSWTFSKLPGDDFEITYVPKANYWARILIAINPFGLSCILGIILVILHCYLILYYRKRNINRKFSPAVIIGSLIVPILFLISYIYFYDFIDNIIGADASRYHGYVFLIIFLYPFLLLFYWLIMWLMDHWQKRKLKAK